MFIRLTKTSISIRFSLVSSHRCGRRTPRQRHWKYLGSIKHADLTNADKVENFLSLAVQSLYSVGLSTTAIRSQLESLAAKIPAFATFFLNFK